MTLYRKAYLFLISLLTLLSAGCLKTDPIHIPNRVEILFEVDNMNSAIISGTDTLQIQEFKFISNEFTIIAKDSAKLEPRVNSMVFRYLSSQTEESLVLGVNIGFENIDNFIGFSLSIDRAGLSSITIDPDFYFDDEFSSIIVKGTMNGKTFTFRSALTLDKDISFDPIQLSEEMETLVISVMLDAEEIFLDDESNIINPDDSENIAQINTAIRNSLTIEASSANRF